MARKLCVSIGAFFLVLLMLFCIINLRGYVSFFDDEGNFEDATVGERILDNRDGYGIKINTSFWILKTYSEKSNMTVYKLIDKKSVDLGVDSELYYQDPVDKLFCNDDEIIVFSKADNNYIIIDCNDKNNIQILSENKLEIDLSKYNEMNLLG